MRRSEINLVINEASKVLEDNGWILPPNPKWDVTDFGLKDFNKIGLVLINLAEQPEYCEKIMYVKNKQITPTHYHKRKKEDIICRWGKLAVKLEGNLECRLQVNGVEVNIDTEKPLILLAGERITLIPGVSHSFWAESEYAVVGEVSTANDDQNDNFFADTNVGRYSKIEEDEAILVKLISE